MTGGVKGFFLVLTAALFILIVTLLTFAFFPSFTDLTHQVRTAPVSESLSCTTTTLTTCSVTLTNKHTHGDASHITVTETSPGSGIRTASLNSNDRFTLTVSGLDIATAFTFTVASERVPANVGSELDDVLNILPFILPGLFIIMGLIFIAKIFRSS